MTGAKEEVTITANPGLEFHGKKTEIPFNTQDPGAFVLVTNSGKLLPIGHTNLDKDLLSLILITQFRERT